MGTRQTAPGPPKCLTARMAQATDGASQPGVVEWKRKAKGGTAGDAFRCCLVPLFFARRWPLRFRVLRPAACFLRYFL